LPASCRRGLQPDLDILGIHASQGAILSRNSHILGDLSITSLESRFCDPSSRRRPVTPTFPGFSVASRLESRFYRQLADSREFTEIANKLNARNPDKPTSEIAPRHTRGLGRALLHGCLVATAANCKVNPARQAADKSMWCLRGGLCGSFATSADKLRF
jgi:hypothetical protein